MISFFRIECSLFVTLEFPSPKDALCQVWLKSAQWFSVSGLCRRRLLNFLDVFSHFRNYLPLKRDEGPSFKQTYIPFTQECFVPSLIEIRPVVLEKKNFKFLSCILAIS